VGIFVFAIFFLDIPFKEVADSSDGFKFPWKLIKIQSTAYLTHSS
jgi:hypothetical protein